MKISVTTPTGSIGRKVLAQLLAPEFSVRVIARDSSRLPETIREQVELVRGATEDAATLRRALDGVEALFWCVPPASLHEVNVRAHYERFALAGCQAIREAGTPRVVTISAGGTVLGRSAGPISGLHAMEEILNQSGAAIRHLRCGWFMENFLRQAEWICGPGVFSYPLPGHIAIPMAAARDIADVALKWLVRRDWAGIKGVRVYGPEDLSFNQAAAIIERVLEKPVRYTEVSAEDYIRNMVRSGASVHHARSVAAMFAALGGGIPGAQTRTDESTTSTSLAVWTQTELLPIMQSPGPRLEPEAASPVIGKAQQEISLRRHARFLQCSSVARTRTNLSQFYERGRHRFRTNEFGRRYGDTPWESRVGEGI